MKSMQHHCILVHSWAFELQELLNSASAYLWFAADTEMPVSSAKSFKNILPGESSQLECLWHVKWSFWLSMGVLKMYRAQQPFMSLLGLLFDTREGKHRVTRIFGGGWSHFWSWKPRTKIWKPSHHCLLKKRAIMIYYKHSFCKLSEQINRCMSLEV